MRKLDEKQRGQILSFKKQYKSMTFLNVRSSQDWVGAMDGKAVNFV
jgi:hypothetical protein